MKLIKQFFLITLIIAAATLSPLVSRAQPGDPCGDPSDPLCPIDGGVSLLIAAGIGIAAKKAHDAKKTQELK